jgi:hypothetical protein
MAGRPTDYRPEYVEQAVRLCKIGATDADIALFFGVAPQTIKTWRHKHEEFNKAVKRGKAVADEAVKQSLFRMATGYSIDTEEVLVVNGQIVHEPVTKFIAPTSSAAIFWLKNRQGWRDQPADKGPTGNEAVAAALVALADRLPV